MGRDEKIERLLRAGTPKIRIARQLGIAPETVDRVAVRLGFPARRRGNQRRDWDEVRRYYEQGHTAAACQSRFSVSPSSWRAAIARGDVVPRPRRSSQELPGVTRREVAKLLEQGI